METLHYNIAGFFYVPLFGFDTATVHSCTEKCYSVYEIFYSAFYQKRVIDYC